MRLVLICYHALVLIPPEIAGVQSSCVLCSLSLVVVCSNGGAQKREAGRWRLPLPGHWGQLSSATKIADSPKAHSFCGRHALGRVMQMVVGPVPGPDASVPSPASPVAKTLDFRDKSAPAASFCEALNFAHCPDAPRPARAAPFGRGAKRGASPRAGNQARSALGGPDWVPFPF